MNIDDLIKELQDIRQEHGNLKVIQQGDQEGNSYDLCRGADVTYLNEDEGCCYDTSEEVGEAIEEGYLDSPDDVTLCVVLYP